MIISKLTSDLTAFLFQCLKNWKEIINNLNIKDMTREDEIRLTADKYCLDEYTRLGFVAGAEWADSHPHWRSVEDEEPPKGQWIITYEPTSPIVVGTDIILPDETADEHNITHWMPLPTLSCSDFPNNQERRVIGTANHIKTALDVMKKGGEE